MRLLSAHLILGEAKAGAGLDFGQAKSGAGFIFGQAKSGADSTFGQEKSAADFGLLTCTSSLQLCLHVRDAKKRRIGKIARNRDSKCAGIFQKSNGKFDIES